MKHTVLVFGTAVLVAACSAPIPDTVVTVSLDRRGAEVAPSMYGIFFEEINHAGDGGLYAELVQNRGFEDTSVPEGYTVRDGKIYPPRLVNHQTGSRTPEDMSFRWYTEEIPGWSLVSRGAEGASMGLTREKPLHPASPTALKVTLPETGSASVQNSGFWGMNIREGASYKLRLYEAGTFDGTVTVRLVGKDDTVLGSFQAIGTPEPQWQEVTGTLTATGSDPQGHLELLLEGSGTLLLDYVSLFPEDTFRGHENGLRKDVAEMLEGLHPAFIRWPGGCIVEGISLDNRVRWKETLGDSMTRPGIYDTWGYHATMGFGYHEFLQLCEDLGAEGMFVCNVGLGCQGRVGDTCAPDEIQGFVQDALDAIDYALGDGSTPWSARRIAAGHPDPFPLKYVEIGNENWGPVYEHRYRIFYDAIKAQYPDLVLISNLGLGGQTHFEKVDMIDPHWYVSPEWFFSAPTLFDGQPRGDYGIYVGEYAASNDVGTGNLLAALSEAAFLTGAERNGDLVKMTSYAPLFENVNDQIWPANLIWLDSYRVMGRVSYYVQQLFAENRPDYNFPVDFEGEDVETKVHGRVGVGAYTTDNEYKDLKVTLPDGRVLEPGISEGWESRDGTWRVTPEGTLRCEGPEVLKWALWNSPEAFGDCTIEVKARKLSGTEGFILFFGMDGDDGFLLNVGGWGNSNTAFQAVHGSDRPQLPGNVAQIVETGRWYDIRVDVEGGTFSCFIDGEPTLSVTRESAHRFCVSGYDQAAGELVLKLVNATPDPFTARILLDGKAKVASQGTVITLSNPDPDAENTLDDPKKIAPVERSAKGFSNDFTRTFQPWSLTILRIPAEL